MESAHQTSPPPALFDRLDESPDCEFYLMPRFVAHIDQATIAALTAYYAEILFRDADVLDLMSSWISHLPESPPLGRVAGLGMNDAELAANPRLSDYAVHDLNADPTLPYDAGAFDFVLIAVSIQYLIRPFEVFHDIARVLKRGGRAVVSTSRRCFPTKAIRAFNAEPRERLALIGQYFANEAAFMPAELLDRSPLGADPLWIVTGVRR